MIHLTFFMLAMAPVFMGLLLMAQSRGFGRIGQVICLIYIILASAILFFPMA